MCYNFGTALCRGSSEADGCLSSPTPAEGDISDISSTKHGCSLHSEKSLEVLAAEFPLMIANLNWMVPRISPLLHLTLPSKPVKTKASTQVPANVTALHVHHPHPSREPRKKDKRNA